MAVNARSRLQRGMIGLMCASHMGLEGCHHFLPVTVPLLLATFGIEYVHYGNLALVALILTTGCQPFFGWLADRWRPELMVPLSILWVGLGMSLSGLMPSFWMLSTVVIAASLGSAMFHPAAAIMTLRYAGTRPGMMFSVFSLGGTLGVAMSPLLINYILPMIGLKSTLIYAPVAFIASSAIYIGFRRMRSPMRPQSHRKSVGRGKGRTPIQSSAWVLLGLLLLSTMARSWIYGAFNSFLPSWALTVFDSQTMGGELLATMAVGGAIGSLVGGFSVDRFSGWKILAIAMAGMSMALWGIFMAPRLAIYPLVAFFGLAQGSTLAVPVIMARRIIPGQQGLAAALMMGIAWVPAGIGAWVTGFLADHLGIADALAYLTWIPLIGVVTILGFAFLWRRTRPPAPSLAVGS